MNEPDLSQSVDAILCRLEGLGIRLGLDRMREMLARLGNPEKSVPAVMVAGSNGKGSTSALLASIGLAAGYRTALYTSPHLERVEERLQIDGEPISDGSLGRILARIVEVTQNAGDGLPTYFEAMTLAAFLWFAEERADLSVLEVGLGGRLDATNVAEPILSLITSISLEHREMLGETLTAIAREKAGILRSGKPALAWIEAPEALESARAEAARIGANLSSASDRVRILGAKPRGWKGQVVEIETDHARYRLDLALPGAHQLRNLGLAVAAAEELAALGWNRIDRAAIESGIATCRWPGRLESIVLSNGKRIVLDAAHNPEGAEMLGRFLAERQVKSGEAVDLLLGLLGDKDAAEMLGHLVPHIAGIVLTAPPSPRAKDPAELIDLLPSATEAEVIPDLDAALERALEMSPRTLVVCGSIFLIGAVRERLRGR
ncbi:MAG: folylpolyglutamate synthase/dihydrofolate synthase family protein [Acidobacteriota bacterium]